MGGRIAGHRAGDLSPLRPGFGDCVLQTPQRLAAVDERLGYDICPGRPQACLLGTGQLTKEVQCLARGEFGMKQPPRVPDNAVQLDQSTTSGAEVYSAGRGCRLAAQGSRFGVLY